MSDLREKILSQIESIKSEVSAITNQIEIIRNEGDPEDVSIMYEFQSRLEILTEKVALLNSNLSIYEAGCTADHIRPGRSVDISTGSINKTVTVVLPEDADPTLGYISVESPLGNALNGKKAGENVMFQTPAGEREFTISALN